MYRKEAGSYIEECINLQKIKGYEKSGRRLKELLEEWNRRSVKLEFKEKTVEPEWMISVYKMIIERVHEELVVEQRAGIKRALEKKRAGTGEYGRPRVKLPSDFEEQLKIRIKNNEDLSHYCEEIKMKKSTFYKWAKVYKDSWNAEEISSDG